MDNKNKIRIVITDDMEALHRRLERLISTQDDMEIVGSAYSGKEAIEVVRQTQPDIVLLDVEMETPDDGIQAAKEISALYPLTKIIMLTVHDSDDIVFEAFQNVISNYLLKTLPPEELVRGIRDAYDNTPVLQTSISLKLQREFRRIRDSEASLLYVLNYISKLTVSELEVLKLLCQGKTKREICDIRVVEYDTVKKQVSSIIKKFDKTRIAEVVELINRSQILKHLPL